MQNGGGGARTSAYIHSAMCVTCPHSLWGEAVAEPSRTGSDALIPSARWEQGKCGMGLPEW